MAVNDELQDLMIEHAVDLERVKAGLVDRVTTILEGTRRDILDQLRGIDPAGPPQTTYRRTRLRKLLGQIDRTLGGAYGRMSEELLEGLQGVARAEHLVTVAAINDAVGFDISHVTLSPSRLESLAKGTIVRGLPTERHWKAQLEDVRRSFERHLTLGIVEGQTTEEIARRVGLDKTIRKAIGPSGAIPSRDIMRAARRNATALTRTSVINVHNAARLETYQDNSDIIEEIQWLSTLDTRTTIECMTRDGKRYTLAGDPVGHSIPFLGGPPVHWQCRSTTTPVLRSWDSISTLTTAGGTQKSKNAVFRQRLRERGWSEERIKKARQRLRASMDGGVPRKTTYSAWLRRMEKKLDGEALERFIQRTLGRTRWNLWRSGKIKFEQLIDQQGNPLSVDALERLAEKKAIKKKAIKEPKKPKEPAKAIAFYDGPDKARILAAFKEQKDVQRLVREYDPPGVVKYDLKGDHDAYFRSGDGIHMADGYKTMPGKRAITLQHEYGHHLDWEIMQRQRAAYFRAKLLTEEGALDAISDYPDLKVSPVKAAAFRKENKHFISEAYMDDLLADSRELVRRPGALGPTWDQTAAAVERGAKLKEEFVDILKGEGVKEPTYKQVTERALKDKAGITVKDFRTCLETAEDADLAMTVGKMEDAQLFENIWAYLGAIENGHPKAALAFSVDVSIRPNLHLMNNDYVGSVTKNVVGRGHETSYYERMGKGKPEFPRAREAFANFIVIKSQATGTRKTLEAIWRKMTPRTWKNFEGILAHKFPGLE